MDWISILVSLIVFGVLLYIVSLIPMNPTVRKIVMAVAFLILVLWLLSAFGFYDFPTRHHRRA